MCHYYSHLAKVDFLSLTILCKPIDILLNKWPSVSCYEKKMPSNWISDWQRLKYIEETDLLKHPARRKVKYAHQTCQLQRWRNVLRHSERKRKKNQYKHKGCYFFRITYLLIRVCQIADRDRDMQTGKPRSRLMNLICQFIDSQNTIKKRLRAKL